MRVVQVGKYYYPYMGGIENHLYLLATELGQKTDLDVVVSNTGPRTLRDVVEGVSVTRCGTIARFASTSFSPSMPHELSARKYDVLHLHLPHPMGALAYLGSRQTPGHRLIVTYHSDVVRQRVLNAAYAPLVDRVLRRADVVIATSPNYLETSPVLQRFTQKCVVVPYGIDLARYERNEERNEEARRIRERYGSAPLLLGVGRLIYYKGFEYAIRALAKVPAARLLLIGDGPLRSDLERTAQQAGVADRVTFLGDLHNHLIAPYYLASDVYLLPSIARSEAFGIVQIEALAAGIPVINTSLPSGVPYVSRDGESGFTVPPNDPDALAAAISRLIADPELRRRFGEAGRQRAVDDFSKETLVRRMLALYEGRAIG